MIRVNVVFAVEVASQGKDGTAAVREARAELDKCLKKGGIWYQIRNYETKIVHETITSE